jgi:hypothetical protein
LLKSLLSIILLFIIASGAKADVFVSENDLRPFTDKIMEMILKGELKKAFNTIKPYIVTSEAELQAAAQNSETQRVQLAEKYGAPIGYEFIGQKKVGESLIRIIYIEKLEKQALIWAFYFYKSKNGWVINSFVWDDQMSLIYQIN